MQKKSKIIRIVCLILALTFIMTMSTVFTTTVMAAEVTLVSNNRAGLQTAITNAGNTSTTIIISESFSFDATAVTIPATANITIRSSDGSSFILTKNTSGRHFTVSGILTLENIVLDGSTEGTPATAAGGGVQVNATGKFTMNSGAVIQNCTATAGGGVYVNNSSFTMNGGVISGSKATTTNAGTGGGGVYVVGANSLFDMNGGVISGNTAVRYGCGVAVNTSGTFNMYGGAAVKENAVSSAAGYLYGGGVSLNGSKFNMYGGEITDNKLFSSGNASCDGGGVYMASGSTGNMYDGAVISDNTIDSYSSNSYGGGVNMDGVSPSTPCNFIMHGGEISNNSAIATSTNTGNHSGGGGIIVRYSTFTMNSGTIHGNSATATTTTGTNFGGGVLVSVNSTFTMNNGTIRGNDVTSTSSTSGGGGVYVEGSANFIMEDGLLAENTAFRDGGGVLVNGQFTLNGGEITGNAARNGNGGGVRAGSTYAGMANTVSFNMKGGKISGNTAGGNGGGVYLYTGSASKTSILTMYDGEIRGNGKQLTINGTAYGPVVNGGGVYVYGSATFGTSFNMGDPSGLVSGNPIISGNHAAGSGTGNGGGGVYVAGKGMMTVYGTSSIPNITENEALKGNGGGIYTADPTYNNLITAGNTIFSANKSAAVYIPPDNAAALYPNIGFASVSTSNHPLNNYDINYTSGRLLAYHIIYNANGGTGSHTGPDIPPGGTDTVLSAPAAGISRTGHTFAGWNADMDGSGFAYGVGDIITLNDDVILYAQWDVNEYTITFDSNGGTPVDSQTIPYGGKAAEPSVPVKQSHTFAGWYTDNDTFENPWDFDTDTVTGNMTLYAQWDVNGYTVTFDSNGGTPVDSQTVPYGGKAAEPALPAKQGHTFAGWYTDNNTFENPWDFDADIVTGDMTLYAGWTESGESSESSKPPESSESSASLESTKSAGSTGSGTNNPETGANNSMVLWIISIATMGMLLLIISRKKKRKDS